MRIGPHREKCLPPSQACWRRAGAGPRPRAPVLAPWCRSSGPSVLPQLRAAPAVQARRPVSVRPPPAVSPPHTKHRDTAAPVSPARGPLSLSQEPPREPRCTCGAGRAVRGSAPPSLTRPPSPAGYAPSDMPVKAKRSTYNYSLPITVKKTSKGLGLPCRAGTGKEGHPDCGRGRGLPKCHSRALLASAPRVGGGGRGAGEISPCIPDPCRGPLAASQLVTMHDLKQGLGPSGSASAQKSSPNKYKLKVGVGRLPAWARVRGGWSGSPSPGQAGPCCPH